MSNSGKVIILTKCIRVLPKLSRCHFSGYFSGEYIDGIYVRKKLKENQTYLIHVTDFDIIQESMYINEIKQIKEIE
jgi:hypothetical protein